MLLLPATITAREARDVLALIAQALQREPDHDFVVEAANLQRFDSAALALLLECRRLARAWGKGFVLRNVPPKLASLARLYGVDALLFGAATASV